MEYHHSKYAGADAQLSFFPYGRREGHVYISPSDPSEDAELQLRHIAEAAHRVASETGLCPVFMRWLLSDPTNQSAYLPQENLCATSVIRQPPMDGTKGTLLMILEEDADFKDQGDGTWLDSRRRLWMGDDDSMASEDSRLMTTRYLDRLEMKLSGMGGSLKDHCLRTWLYVRDIDNNYKGVVKGRNDVFNRLGLTPATHFIASTGIEGAAADTSRLVSFNAIANLNVTPAQVTYLHGYTHLNPTYEYGVAFERGVAIDYADRRHVYISGTASIDSKGGIVAPGDIKAQTERMLENIGVLLREGDCGWDDVAHITVYLRDTADFRTVSDIMESRLPDLPKAVVLAPVCRPGWLVEAECMAIKQTANPLFPIY